MPYERNAELPKEVKVLPTAAQTMFRKAFNSASGDNPEDVAFRIAWSAVKKVYRQNNEGEWILKDTQTTDENVTHVEIHETITLDEEASKMRLTEDGRLLAFARAARTGIQLYKGSELGRPDMEVVRVYRPEDQVFDKASLQSYAHRPVTDDHPPEGLVTTKTFRKRAVGFTGEDILRDGEFVRVPFMLADEETITKVRDGKRELSLGYTMDLKWEQGATMDGEEYDAVQTNIRANHLAVVAKARGGDKLRIGDKTKDRQSPAQDDRKQETSVMPEVKTTQIMLGDGETVEVVDVSARKLSGFIDNMKKRLDNLAAELEKTKEEGDKKAKDAADEVRADMQKQLDEKTAELTTVQKQLEDAQSPDILDQRVTERSDVIAKAKAVVGDKVSTDGKTTEAIRREVVNHVLGDDAKDWTDDQVTASFRALTKSVKADADPIRDGFRNRHSNQPDTQKVLDEYNERISNAWKGEAANA